MDPAALKKMLEDLGLAVKGVGESATATETKIKELADANVSMKTRLEAAEKLLQTRSALPAGGVSLPGVADEKEKFSFIKAYRGIATKNWKGCEFEQKVFEEAAKKAAYDSTVDSTGGYIVPNEIVREIIELLRAKTVVRELGASTLDGLTASPVELPKQTAGATAYWVAENSSITESEGTFGMLTMQPHKLAALSKMSNRMLRLSDPALEAIVRNDMALVLARKLDLACLRGTGGAGEPVGILNTTGIGSVALGTAGGAITIDAVYNLMLQVESADGNVQDRMGFAMHPKVWNKLRQLKAATTGAYYLQPDPTVAAKGTLCGYPYRTTTQIPTNLTKGTGVSLSELYFGDWSQFIMASWGGLELRASQETSDAFAKDMTWIRAITEVDLQIRHVESFAVMADIQTA